MSDNEPASPAPGAAGIKAIAADLSGAVPNDARVAAITAEIAKLADGVTAAGPVPFDAAPGAQFRRVLLAGAAGPRRA